MKRSHLLAVFAFLPALAFANMSKEDIEGYAQTHALFQYCGLNKTPDAKEVIAVDISEISKTPQALNLYNVSLNEQKKNLELLSRQGNAIQTLCRQAKVAMEEKIAAHKLVKQVASQVLANEAKK